MKIFDVAFETTNWSEIAPSKHDGEVGIATWRTKKFGAANRIDGDAIRVRMVEYSAGYVADHWCAKGHILLCLEGELHTELTDGRTFLLTPGMSYQVADGAESHRSSSPKGCKLFIVD